MRKFAGIIESTTVAPPINYLWIKDNDALYFTNGKWVSLLSKDNTNRAELETKVDDLDKEVRQIKKELKEVQRKQEKILQKRQLTSLLKRKQKIQMQIF